MSIPPLERQRANKMLACAPESGSPDLGRKVLLRYAVAAGGVSSSCNITNYGEARQRTGSTARSPSAGTNEFKARLPSTSVSASLR